MLRTNLRRILLLLLLCPLTVGAQVQYMPEDSLRVCQLLREAQTLPPDSSRVLHFGHQLLGTPYVGQTLDQNQEEQLVVNLRQLDCTTFVETVVALTLTARARSTSFSDYLRHLRTIRYSGGQLRGYASRNHYFSQWIESNARLGLVEEITSEGIPFTASQKLRLTYMSRHPDAYPMLRRRPDRQQAIARMERQASGGEVRYIPLDRLAGSPAELPCIHSGDLLAIVTRKDGLDTSHIGIAEWDTDGRLHLLNASSIHKKVILEPLTLHQYMLRHPTFLGVRVVRLRREQPCI